MLDLNYKLLIIFFIVLISISLLYLPNITFADDLSTPESNNNGCPDGSICLDNPLGPQDPDINVLIGGVIRAILGIIGSISLAMFTYGGFVWLTSAGNTERVQKGKAIFTWGTVGMIIILTAAAFVRFVLGIFG